MLFKYKMRDNVRIKQTNLKGIIVGKQTRLLPISEYEGPDSRKSIEASDTPHVDFNRCPFGEEFEEFEDFDPNELNSNSRNSNSSGSPIEYKTEIIYTIKILCWPKAYYVHCEEDCLAYDISSTIKKSNRKLFFVK